MADFEVELEIVDNVDNAQSPLQKLRDAVVESPRVVRKLSRKLSLKLGVAPVAREPDDGLSDDQREKLRASFRHFDVDGSGLKRAAPENFYIRSKD